jgi:hypothetical protein
VLHGRADEAELAALTAVLLARAARIAADDRAGKAGPRRPGYATYRQSLNAESEFSQPNSWRRQGHLYAANRRAKHRIPFAEQHANQ